MAVPHSTHLITTSCWKIRECKQCTVQLKVSPQLLRPSDGEVDNTIHWIHLYPVDNAIFGLHSTYLLDSDLSGRQRYLTFKNQGLVDSPILLLNN